VKPLLEESQSDTQQINGLGGPDHPDHRVQDEQTNVPMLEGLGTRAARRDVEEVAKLCDDRMQAPVCEEMTRYYHGYTFFHYYARKMFFWVYCSPGHHGIIRIGNGSHHGINVSDTTITVVSRELF